MLRLQGVGKRYGGRTVLRDVCLTLSAASVTLLAGANGSGKSTLLQVMAGLCRPTSGTVTHALPPGSIGYLGHKTLIYSELSALENLRFWATLHRLAPSENTLLNALDRMDLGSFAQAPARTFSRGMAQRLSLARLFLLAPSLILLDEPGTGLDDASLSLLQREIRCARERGAALVWVTHTPEQDMTFADALLRLEKTRLVHMPASSSAQVMEPSCC